MPSVFPLSLPTAEWVYISSGHNPAFLPNPAFSRRWGGNSLLRDLALILVEKRSGEISLPLGAILGLLSRYALLNRNITRIATDVESVCGIARVLGAGPKGQTAKKGVHDVGKLR
jgi:hypothetical protein